MRRAEPLSIRWWLGGLVAGVGLPLLVLLSWMYVRQVGRERMEARDQAQRIVAGAAARIRARHAESLALLARFAARPAVQRFDGTACDPLFTLVDLLPQYGDLFLLDRGGRVVCGQRRQLRPLVALTRGVPHGTLVLTEEPAALLEEELARHVVVTLIDGKGRVLARSEDPAVWVGRSVTSSEIAAMVMRHKSGMTEAVGIDGKPRQYAFVHLPELDWYLYAGIPTAVVMQPLRETYVAGIAWGIVIVLLLVLVATLLSRTVERPLASLAHAAESARRGAFDEVAVVEGPREVVTLARAFNDMVTARAHAEQRAHDDEKKLRALSERLLVVQEEERTRIARELHDDLGQLLTALKMDVIGLLEQSQLRSPIAGRILRTFDSTVTVVQRISSELRPSILDDLGLVAALESEAHLFEQRTGVECELSLPDSVSIEGGDATAVYRIVQEALTNVARHSDATRVEIRLRERPGEMLLEIRDDGRGILQWEATDPTSLGLLGMRERAELLGGSVVFEGVPDRGTIVSVRIPRKQEGS